MPTKSLLTDGWDTAYRDNPTVQLWSEEPMPILETIVSRARARNLQVGVDLGCGEGRNLLALRRAGLEVSGLDISPTALSRADQLLRDSGDAAPLIVGDVTQLPFADATLDIVTALDVAGQIPDPRPMLAEANRVLRAGGLLVVNLFALEDDTYGVGEEVASHTYLYHDTLFRYFEETEIEEMFGGGWELDVEKVAWTDPPHGSFRPSEHRHVSYVIYGTLV